MASVDWLVGARYGSFCFVLFCFLLHPETQFIVCPLLRDPHRRLSRTCEPAATKLEHLKWIFVLSCWSATTLTFLTFPLMAKGNSMLGIDFWTFENDKIKGTCSVLTLERKPQRPPIRKVIMSCPIRQSSGGKDLPWGRS